MVLRIRILMLHFNRHLLLLYFLVFFLFFTSCVTQRSVEYIRDKNKTITTFDEARIDAYKIKPMDELYIHVTSPDDATVNVFTNTGTQQVYNLGSLQPYGASLLSYTVDKEGCITLPVIGKFSVQNKTLTEVREMITESLMNILNRPMVTVKLVNRYVSVLGEVQRPGHYAYAQDKLTVYDALGLAGDITEYGNRKNVILTRNEDGKNIRINIDLTQSDILASEYYYMRPGDLVYVKPLRRKFWNMRQFPYSIILSTITTAILIYNVIE